MTNDLHRDDPNVIMTDFEARFAAEGVKINRCVATVADLPEQAEQVEALSLLQYWQEGERVPHGMEWVVEQERLRRQAEERKGRQA